MVGWLVLYCILMVLVLFYKTINNKLRSKKDIEGLIKLAAQQLIKKYAIYIFVCELHTFFDIIKIIRKVTN